MEAWSFNLRRTGHFNQRGGLRIHVASAVGKASPNESIYPYDQLDLSTMNAIIGCCFPLWRVHRLPIPVLWLVVLPDPIFHKTR